VCPAHRKAVTGPSTGTVEPVEGCSRAFDEEVFDRLLADLGSEAIAMEFLLTFDALLDTRIERVDRALKEQDREEIETALMSLQASAGMGGATELEATATRALAHRPVQLIPRGPLVRQLEGKANYFRQALIDFRRRRITPAA
jgi:hypothetical protein